VALEAVFQRLDDVRQLPQLLGGERVEQPPPDLFDMARGRPRQRRETPIGELGDRRAPIRGVLHSANVTGFLQPGHGMGEPAGGEAGDLRQVGHGQAAVRGF